MDSSPQVFSNIDSMHLKELAKSVEQEFLISTIAPGRQSEQNEVERFNMSAEAALKLSSNLNLNITTVCVRILNLGLVDQFDGADLANNMVKFAVNTIKTLASDADLTGRNRGTEFSALYIAPEMTRIDGLCEDLKQSIENWNKDRPALTPGLICQISLFNIPPTASGSYSSKTKRISRIHSTIPDPKSIA